MKKVIVPGVFFTALSAPVLIQEAQAASNDAVVKYVNVESNSSLNVRKSASTSAAVVTTIKKGKEVTVLSESNGWSKITVDGKTGYVSTAYLSEKTSTYIKYVSIDQDSTLNVRSTPNTSSSVVTKIKANTKVEVSSATNGWSKIKVNGKEGYVASKYLADTITTVKENTSKDTSSKQNTVAETKTTTMYVNVDQGSSLNMRNKASNSGSVIVKLARGVQVTSYGDSDGWTKVNIYGKEGYVATQYLSKTKPSASATGSDSSNVVKTTTKYVNVTKGSSLNMRSSASTSASVVSKLTRGTKVTVTSESKGWAKITAGGKTGYVSTSYLSASNPDSQSSNTGNSNNTDTGKETTVTKYVNVTKGSSLNMRSSASTSASVVSKLTRGTKVTVTSESKGWAKITAGGKTGYVSTSYLSASNPDSQSSNTGNSNNTDTGKETTVTKYVNVTKGSSLNMRSSASTSASVVSKLTRGTKVTVTSESKGWAKITAGGKTGYVSTSYLSASNPDSQSGNTGNTETGEDKTVTKYVNVDKNSTLNMRSSANTTASVVTKLARGTAVTVVSESKGWAKVVAGGKTGYVSSSYLSASKLDDNAGSDSKPDTGAGTGTGNSEQGTTTKYVNVSQGSSLNMRSKPSTSGSVVAKLAAGTSVKVYSEADGWAKVTANGQEGYVSSEFLTTKQAETPGVSIGDTIKTYANYGLTLDEMADIQMKVNPQTDKVYNVYIREDAIAFKSSDPTKGTVLGSGWRLRGGAGTEYQTVNSVQNGQVLTITSKVKGSDGYYWYKVNSTQSWGSASKEDTTYYLDPNNFLDNTVQSMQFLKLSAKADINDEEVDARILAGKGVLSGKASSFITAANAYGVNEIYLISHALLETGNGTSTLANGVKVNGKTVYNMYGIGAYDGSAVSSGAQYAYNAGWFTPEAAIIGGAKFIAQGYINAGQDTLYKMRWNPNAADKTGKATHQYATDIGWASKQVTQIYNLYSLLNSYTLKLEIPVYK